MKRRLFLVGSAAAALLAGGGWFWERLFARRKSVETHVPLDPPEAEPVFPAADRALLIALIDQIVPRDGDAPAASEIGLLPRLEDWARQRESRLAIYRKGWPRLRAYLEKERSEGGEIDFEGRSLHDLYMRYRRSRRSGPAAHCFEQFRRDVLRLYYSSPEGWASVAYTGPVRRSHPDGPAPS